MQDDPNAERARALVERARRDPEALRDLYTAYFPRVYGYVRSRVAHVEDAEDLVATAMLRMVEALPSFVPRGDGSFGAWLFRIAHNLVVDFHRRRAYGDGALPVETLDELPDERPSPEALAQRFEDSVRLHELICELPPRRQEVIAMRFFGGLRNREIAEVLGLDERAVASHLCRALEELRQKCAGDSVFVEASTQ